MRKLLLAAPATALLALSAAAWAGPQRLDEGRLGGVAAGQDAGATPGFSTVVSQPTENSTNFNSSTSTSNSASQMLGGSATNQSYATGIFSNNVTAAGMANTSVIGTINGVP